MSRLGRPAKRTAPRVLVADDEAPVRALARVALEADGWSVIEASTPADALRIATGQRPEVVLLDVTFAGSERDGYAVCREIKSRGDTRDMRVVLFTAHDDAESRAFASAVGAAAFIVKPFSPLDLAQMVRLVRDQPKSEPGLGLYLIEAGILRPEQLERALAEQRMRQGERVPLGRILVELGYASTVQVDAALDRQRRVEMAARGPAPGQRTLRVAVADDNASVREALRELFATTPDCRLVGLARDGAEALRLVRATRPDVVVLDNDMPSVQGLDVLRAVRSSMPEVVIVMFTLDQSIAETALDEGATAVLTKDMPLDALLAAIRRPFQPAAAERSSSKLIVTTRSITRADWRRLARIRRVAAHLAVLLTGYAAGFLVLEPTLQASAAALTVPTVALGGALLGSEAGMILAVAAVIETAGLWAATGHVIGEPILRIGGNGLGIVALIGIGAGFGAMRLLGGRFDVRNRKVSALAEAALTLSAGLVPTTLGMLAQAALEIVPGEAALLFLPRPGGALELVAAVGAKTTRIGDRPGRGLVADAYAGRRSKRVDELPPRALGFELARMRSALVAPVLGLGGTAAGVLAVASMQPARYGVTHERALESYTAFLSALIAAPPAVVAVDAAEGRPAQIEG